jgi:gamma-D-glutamyl-L-lysine dipeptidyl-peptidase
VARQKYKEIKDHRHFICNLSVIPVLDKPDHHAAMITQLLFGECGVVLQVKNKNWYKVRPDKLGIEGWIDTNQIVLIPESLYERYIDNDAFLLDIFNIVLNNESSLPILMGSVLRKYDGMSFYMPDGQYICNNLAVRPGELALTEEVLSKLAKKYLNAPYLKSGRTHFGMDAGALLQAILKFFNFSLPILPELQLDFGEVVDFTELAQPGDIVFFQDENGSVYHCGLLLSKNRVIHCDGSVRIDKLDHYGIYNREKKKYTHKLRIIKRVLEFEEKKKVPSD